MPTATLPAARFGLVDAAGHAYRGMSFATERAARQYHDRLPEKFRRMVRTAGFRVGPIETPAPAPAASCCPADEPAPCLACSTTHTEPPAVAEERPVKASPSKPADVCSLVLTIRGAAYRVRGIPADAFGATARAFRLRKVGSTEVHNIAETPHGAECDCPDFIYRRDGIDPAGCKHCRALRALGLIR